MVEKTKENKIFSECEEFVKETNEKIGVNLLGDSSNFNDTFTSTVSLLFGFLSDKNRR